MTNQSEMNKSTNALTNNNLVYSGLCLYQRFILMFYLHYNEHWSQGQFRSLTRTLTKEADITTSQAAEAMSHVKRAHLYPRIARNDGW